MRLRPAMLVVLTFAGLILVGFAALALAIQPGARAETPLMTAAFTSVSAVCVTGLTVVDLSSDVGFSGQLVVLALIQIGGIGVLTLSNWVLLFVRGRLGVYGSVLTHGTVGAHPRLSPGRLVSRIIVFTGSVEAVGAVVLFSRFLGDFSPQRAAWLAVFHSVSAFCNAGFSLFSDSLTAYREDVVVNLTITALVVLGGLGFVVATDLVEWLGAIFKGERHRLAVYSRMVLTTTAVLILAGALTFLVFEWNNTFVTESFGGEFLQSFFLSVTARTAGFNTVETAHLTNMTLVAVIILMIVGASPGSTGGGVKTTSLLVLWALVRGNLLNRPETEIAGRRISRDLVAKALALIVLYGCAVVTGLVLLQATEYGELPHQATRGMFLEHTFEVVSALSTVGLSTGVTTQLSQSGLWVLMGLMFVGRVGPLVVAASLIGERARLGMRLPKVDIMIG